jgi:hypothetical protein
MNCLCITSTINGDIYGIIKTTDRGKTWFRDALLDGTEHKGRITQHITFTGSTPILNTFDDGLRRGTYTPSDIKLETSGVNTSIRPSPATDYIYLNNNDAGTGEASHSVMIYNTLGQCVLTISPNLEVEQLRIDVSLLSPGVYFVRFGNRTEKFLKW